jgi:hypothetical protein
MDNLPASCLCEVLLALSTKVSGSLSDTGNPDVVQFIALLKRMEKVCCRCVHKHATYAATVC